MPVVRVLYDVEGWAYHRRALALQAHAPANYTVEIGPLARGDDAGRALGDAPPDIVLALPGRRAEALRVALTARGWPTRLAVGWTIGWPEWQREFRAAYAAADAVVFNNRIYWEETGRLPRTRVIANGVDLRTFRVIIPPARRRPRVLWLGSEFHRARKGYDDIVLPLRERLRADGIEYDFRLVDSHGGDLLTAAQMADWYNSGTVLLCASRLEGTPNVALEAAACGCTVVAPRVGNMPELIRDDWNGYLVERDLDAVTAGVRKACAAYPRLAAAMAEAIAPWDWSACCRAHFALLDELGAPEWRRDTWS